jgi:hypothetical protein
VRNTGIARESGRHAHGRSDYPEDCDSMIRVQQLVKKFGDFTAVDNVSFDVAKAKFSPSSAPTAQEKPPPSRC